MTGRFLNRGWGVFRRLLRREGDWQTTESPNEPEVIKALDWPKAQTLIAVVPRHGAHRRGRSRVMQTFASILVRVVQLS